MEPLIPPSPVVRRLDRRKLGAVVCTLGVGLGGGLWWVIATQEAAQGGRVRGPREVAETAAEGELPSVSSELRLPASYSQVVLRPPASSPLPAAPVAPPSPTGTGATPSPTSTPLVAPPPAPVDPRGPASSPKPQPPPPVARVAEASPAPPSTAPSKWLFADLKQGGVQEAPFPLPKEDHGTAGPGRQADSLFPQAVWGTPADPRRVLYRSQVINGLLQHDVNSDQPGPIRILVTEAVQDRFGQGHTLLPQYSILLGSQDGKVVFGQARLGISIDSAELPDGTVVALSKAKVAEATGATGVTGTVNNHWVHVGIGAVLTAALSVGSRAVGGSPTGFQPTLSQEFAKDVSQSVNATGQQIVRRSLEVAPTITIPHGTPVAIQLSENVSFQTPAATVHK